MPRRLALPAFVITCMLGGAAAVHLTATAAELATGVGADAVVSVAVHNETGQPVTPPAVQPAPAIHDPVVAPSQAFDELRAAKRLGWATAVLVGLTMLLLALPHLGLKWLATGTRAFVLACATTGCLAAGNAALDGGSWYAVLMAGIVAAAGLWQSNRGPHPAKAVA